MTNFQILVQKSNKTLVEISKDTGISYSTLGNYNQGTRTPKKENAKILADYFGVSISYLMGLSETPSKPITHNSPKGASEYVNFLKMADSDSYTSTTLNDLKRIQQQKKELIEQLTILNQEEDLLTKKLTEEIQSQIDDEQLKFRIVEISADELDRKTFPE